MSTMSLAISGTSIRQDSFGRFCLNDLHKAAGGEKRHQPSNWLALQQVQELIDELKNSVPVITGTEQNQPVTKMQGGILQGTFVVKELVYAYATWISAKFFLSVIRAYDSIVNQKPYALKELPSKTISGKEAAQLKLAIEAIAKKDKHAFSQMYRKLYAAYGIKSYSELPAGKLNEALVFLGLKPVEVPEMVLIDAKELASLKERLARPNFNDYPSIILNIPTTNERILVQKQNGVTALMHLDTDWIVGSEDNVIRDLKARGYIVVKNEKHALETIAKIANESQFVA